MGPGKCLLFCGAHAPVCLIRFAEISFPVCWFFSQAFYGHIKNWNLGFTQGMCEFTERRIL